MFLCFTGAPHPPNKLQPSVHWTNWTEIQTIKGKLPLPSRHFAISLHSGLNAWISQEGHVSGGIWNKSECNEHYFKKSKIECINPLHVTQSEYSLWLLNIRTRPWSPLKQLSPALVVKVLFSLSAQFIKWLWDMVYKLSSALWFFMRRLWWKSWDVSQSPWQSDVHIRFSNGGEVFDLPPWALRFHWKPWGRMQRRSYDLMLAVEVMEEFSLITAGGRIRCKWLQCRWLFSCAELFIN